MKGEVGMLHPAVMHQHRGPTPIGVACTGPVCFRKEETDPKEKDEDLLEEKKTEDALLPEGWNQQVGAEVHYFRKSS